MKTLRLSLIAILLLFIVSCISPVTFNEPQPKGGKDLSEFPAKLIGKYQSSDNVSYLLIGKNIILRNYDYDLKAHIKEMDSTYKLSGDTLINIETKEKYITKKVGDTIIYHVNLTDTLFRLSDNNVLRKFKGYYFLNTFEGKENWTVEKLDLTKGKLTLGQIRSTEDITKLNEIVESPKDTISTHFNLTKKQFRKFVKSNSFTDIEVFTRMK